jgi:hypothetical protein
MALQGIQISNNFAQTKIQFQQLMSYMETSLKTPLLLNLNINGIQGQLKQVTAQAQQMGQSINSSLGGIGNVGGLDKMSRTVQNVGEGYKQMAETIVKVTSNMGQTTTVTEKWLTNMQDGVAILNNLGEKERVLVSSVTKTTDSYKQQNIEREKALQYEQKIRSAIGQENKAIADNLAIKKQESINRGEIALVERENGLLNQATVLLREKYGLEQQSVIAKQKGLIPLENELLIRKQTNAVQLQQATMKLDNNSKNVLLAQEKSLIDGMAIANSKILSQKQLETAEIQRQIGLYQQEKALQVSNVQQKYGSSVNIGDIEKAKLAYTNLNATSLSSLKAQQQSIDMGLKEITADAKASSMAIKEANAQTTSLASTVGAAGGKFLLWMGATTIVMSLIHSISDGVKAITELDEVMTDLQIDMMDLPKSAFDGLIASSRELGIELGSNMKDIDEMMKIYANATTTVDEIMQKTRNSAILSNISSMSAKESTDTIQSIILQFDQFKKSSDDVVVQSAHVNDVLSSIAGNLAVNFKTGVSNISEAVKVSGSVINEAGISYEKYAAIVGKVNEVQRISGSTIGQAIKFVAMVA